MGDPGSHRAPEGVTVDGVDWLPSGSRSGIVRVRGARPAGADVVLPRLAITDPDTGEERWFDSLPDTAAADADDWRGAYVVPAAVALASPGLAAVWPGGERWALGPLDPSGEAESESHLSVVPEPEVVEPDPPAVVSEAVPPAGGSAADDAPPAAGSFSAAGVPPTSPAAGEDAVPPPAASSSAADAPPADLGADVVDPVVLANRRANRAEAAAKVHADTALQALHAIEALELRSAALAQDLESVRAERDALRDRVEPRPPDEPSPREVALERALAERQTELDRLRAATSVRRRDADDRDETERRAAALTQALTESVAEADQLRTELHEQLVLRRTRDVEAAADTVALHTLVRDLEGLRAAADAARAEAKALAGERDAAHVALDHQRAETAGAHAAHEETRRAFTARVAELRAAREVISRLEGELAAVRFELDRERQEREDETALLRDAAETAALAAANRLAEAQAEAARNAEAAAEADALREQVRDREAALRKAEVARELALASALAARAERQAAAVAGADVSPERVASLEAQITTLRTRLAEAEASKAGSPVPTITAPALGDDRGPSVRVPVAPDVIARAAEQVRRAAEARAAAAPDAPRRVVANLDAAAAALRAASAPATPPAGDVPQAAPPEPTVGADPDPSSMRPSPDADQPASPGPTTPADADPSAAAREPAPSDPTVPADPDPSSVPQSPDAGQTETPEPTAADTPRTRRPIQPGPATLPGDLARGTGGRAYPPLRGGLVKLAHDDPRAAADLIAGLAHGAHALTDNATTLDLDLDEVEGVIALDATPGKGTTLATNDQPRPRRDARISLKTNAVTLAEALAGVDHAPRRRGVLRATRGRRKARALMAQLSASTVTLPQLLDAGARLEPALAARAFAYAVPPAWTAGQSFVVRLTVDGTITTLRSVPGRGVDVERDHPQPDAELTATCAELVTMLTQDTPQTDALEPPVRTLLDWARRLAAPPA